MIQRIKQLFSAVITTLLGVYLIYYFNLGAMFYAVWLFSLPVAWLIFRDPKSVVMLYRCAAPLLIGLLFIVFYIEAYKDPVIKEFLKKHPLDDFYGEQFYGVIATLYALITALVIVKGIEAFDKLSAAIIDEANRIRSILEFLEYFRDGSNPAAEKHIHKIRGVFLQYVENVLHQPHADGSKENFVILRNCCKEVATLKGEDENDSIALAEIMKGLNDLFAIRSRRINCALAKIPTYLIFALCVMTLSIILPFFLHPGETFSQNYTMIFLMATFGSFLLFMLLDINAPFDGFWRVDLKEFRDLRDTIKHDMLRSGDGSPKTPLPNGVPDGQLSPFPIGE